MFFEKLDGDLKCKLCERRCVIKEGERGICATRKNIGGKLLSLNYGNISAIESRPIEIKPFYHYYPGSTSLTFSTWSCNFFCPWCQNFHLSKRLPREDDPKVTPEFIVEKALDVGDEGVCVSFQEPTLLTEFAIDVFKIAKKHNLYACYVSNGYMSVEVLEALAEAGMSGLKVDIKGGEEVYKKFCGNIDVWKIWRNVRKALDLGIHVEIVNLVVTDVNEDDVEWVVENHLKYAGVDVPLHFTRYFPAYKFYKPPTKIEVLENAVKLARREGINYVYIGNVPGHRHENTFCPNCNELIIRRYHYTVLEYRIRDKRCPNCKEEIPIFGYFAGHL